MSDTEKPAGQATEVGAGRESFEALRETIGQSLMTEEQFFATHDPAGPEDEVGVEAEDDPAALAAEVDAGKQTAAEKLKKTVEGVDDAEDGDAGANTAKGEAPKQAPEEEAAYEEALRALRRAKTPSDVLRKLTREQVLAWGGPLAKNQADTDRAYTELSELRSKTSEAANPARGATNAPPTEATAQADLAAVQTKLSEVLGLDEEGGAVLREGLDALVKPLASQLAARDQRDSARDAAIANLLLKSAAVDLVDRFPQVKDPAKFGEVAKKARANINSGDYTSVESALEDACKVVFYEAAKDTGEKKALDRARGRMSPPSQRPKAPAAMSLDDRMNAVLAGIDEGASESEIRSRSGW